MKKVFLLATAVALLASCGKTDKTDEGAADKASTATKAATNGVKIAYVEIDSLMSQYQFYKDCNEIMSQEYANIQKELAGKQRTLEQHAASVQKKYESNGFTTRDELERAQAGINREQADLAQLSDRLSNDFAATQQAYNKEILDSIHAFLNVYNKNKTYDFILSKSGENMLYADSTLDITQDIIKGLNKRYKVKPEIAEKLKK